MTTTELCKKAKFLARELNIKNFKCEPSSSWIWRFKQRFNLTSEGFCDQNLTKQIQKWHNLNDPHRPNNQRVYCDFCQTMYIGLDKVERHIAKKHLT
ncbi:hypothetical protein B566_EDAN015940 [Ephemera danica]|nr:hypothetical protein B566_EDAN015940 [Ephemera danica]